MREADLQDALEQWLDLFGYEWFHDRAVNKTHINRPGFPDLVAAHPLTGAVLFLELKSAKRPLTPAQHRWRSALERSKVIYRLVYPDDLDATIALLRAQAGKDRG